VRGIPKTRETEGSREQRKLPASTAIQEEANSQATSGSKGAEKKSTEITAQKRKEPEEG